MPIRPENRQRYPTDWPLIRTRILERAGHKCETCGLSNYSVILRRPDGSVGLVYGVGADHAEAREIAADEHWKTFGDYVHASSRESRIVIIVLTIAHLDHQPENCAVDNLKALCQQCHLRYDLPLHVAHAAARRRAPMAVADLFAGAAHG